MDLKNLLEKLVLETAKIPKSDIGKDEIKACNLCKGTARIRQTSAPYDYIKCPACGGRGIGVKLDGERYLNMEVANGDKSDGSK